MNWNTILIEIEEKLGKSKRTTTKKQQNYHQTKPQTYPIWPATTQTISFVTINFWDLKTEKEKSFSKVKHTLKQKGF